MPLTSTLRPWSRWFAHVGTSRACWRILHEAVRRMLPKNKLGRQMLKKLKIFAGPEHTHQAQQPEPIVFEENTE